MGVRYLSARRIPPIAESARVLKHGEQSFVRCRITVGETKMPGIVVAGDYVARLTLQTWPSDDDSFNRNWSIKLSGEGALLTEPVATGPFHLSVRVNSLLMNCE
jgi:hypothetical protein